jgi:trehalose 6-phosphate phosphatase
LDIFGQVLLLLDTLARIQDCVGDDLWLLTEQLTDAITARWYEADHGIWETRLQPRHHTHSRMMCWVGIDCALRIAARRGVDRPEWRTLQTLIETDIETHGWNAIRSSYVAAYDLAEADSAVLQAFIEGYPAPQDRLQRTVGFVEQQLRRPSGVYRYRYDDGLPLGQGTMHVCSAWLAATHVGEPSADEAIQILDTMLSAAGGTGLLPEQVDPKSRRGLGNHPHVLSHAGVLMLTRHIATQRGNTH